MPSPVASIQYLGHVKSESLYEPFSHLLLSAIAKEQQKNATVRADIFVHNSMLASYKLICEHILYLYICICILYNLNYLDKK